MAQKEVKTPEYWKDVKVFGEPVEEVTAYGNKVMIPKRFINGWQTAKLTKDYAETHGLDPLDGLDTQDPDINPLYYDMERVFYEIYEGND